MKMYLSIAVLGLIVLVLSNGCVQSGAPLTSAPPAGIYNNVAGGIYYQVPMLPLKEKFIIVRRNVVGRSRSYNILGVICSFGDSTYHAAIKDALKDYPSANALVDVYMDLRKEGVLKLYNTTTLEVRGTAIKYLTPEGQEPGNQGNVINSDMKANLKKLDSKIDSLEKAIYHLSKQAPVIEVKIIKSKDTPMPEVKIIKNEEIAVK